MTTIKKYLKFIGYALSAASVVFLVIKFCGIDYSSISIDSPALFVAYSLVGIIIGAISVFILGKVYSRTIKSLCEEGRTPSKGIICAYVRSNLGKYIPGNVFQYVERNLRLKDSGLKQVEIAGSSVLEIGELLVAGILLSCIFARENIMLVFSNVSTPVVLIIIAALVVLFVLVVIILYKKSSVMREMLSRMKKWHFLRTALINILLYMVILLLMSSLMFLAVLSIAPFEVATEYLVRIIAAFTLSWIAGFIVIGAPGGIGIRETVIALLFADTPICEVILAASIIQRVTSILGDVVAFLCTLFFDNSKIKHLFRKK